ncbi:uncharacterized protein BJX67DRAFT_366290 [Aspergillus lucknowensis]|uniref:Uncharacterized protein n=1 Tax=Aspergillus lucknowensis TaxID=176173 RepID=A0ABR4LD37_9EURO
MSMIAGDAIRRNQDTSDASARRCSSNTGFVQTTIRTSTGCSYDLRVWQVTDIFNSVLGLGRLGRSVIIDHGGEILLCLATSVASATSLARRFANRFVHAVLCICFAIDAYRLFTIAFDLLFLGD